jgi:hypothetical protein
MSSSNMTTIWNYVNKNLDRTKPKSELMGRNDGTLKNFAVGFSDYLNELWDAAWNVILVYIADGSNSDSVVYGYAFRQHWFWYNGLATKDGHFISLIVWKDFNCVRWFTLNLDSNASPFTSSFNRH